MPSVDSTIAEMVSMFSKLRRVRREDLVPGRLLYRVFGIFSPANPMHWQVTAGVMKLCSPATVEFDGQESIAYSTNTYSGIDIRVEDVLAENVRTGNPPEFIPALYLTFDDAVLP